MEYTDEQELQVSFRHASGKQLPLPRKLNRYKAHAPRAKGTVSHSGIHRRRSKHFTW